MWVLEFRVAPDSSTFRACKCKNLPGGACLHAGLHSRACFAHPLCPGYPWIRVSPRVSLALLSLFRIIIFKCPKVTLAPDICILLHRKYYWVYFTCMCKRLSPGSHWPWQGGKCSRKPPQCYFPWQPHHGYQALAQQEERNTADYLTHRWASLL